MFQFFFKYPSPVFTKGHFVLLSSWPAWLLPVLIVAAAGGLALLIRWKLREATPRLRSWRAWALWGMQSTFVALLLLLLWQPAGLQWPALSSQQNIIAVVVDDSRSMAIADSSGKTREAAALSVLQDGVLSGLQKRFQTRVYRLGGGVTRVDGLNAIGTHGSRYTSRRRPEATRHGNIRPADWCRAASDRRESEYCGDGLNPG